MLVAPIYRVYGAVLLRIAVSKSDALGDAGPIATAAEGDDDDDESDDDAAATGAPPASAGSGAAATAAIPDEEDLEKEEDDDKDVDDLHIALECLESARLIYSRQEPTKVCISHEARRGLKQASTARTCC